MNKKTKRLLQSVGLVIFTLYLVVLFYLLFFSEQYGRTIDGERILRYNLRPFAEIHRFLAYREIVGIRVMIVNIFGNIAAFLPFGMFLPFFFGNLRKGWIVTLSGCCFSLIVELIQLITRVGCFDVDDIILNTTGALVGYVLFTVADKIRRSYYGKKI
ncbi:MAG: VanZ family protein [Eubacteriales bacterium]|nr:VanZ family protein [Eubacteriales bacterium]